jgi:hypothetical protein
MPQELRDRVQTTCGPACRQEFRRQRSSQLTRDAATRARRLERLRQATSSPQFGEQIRQRALRRSRPYAEVLRALPSAAFAVLSAPERDLLRRYYGLDADPPQTLDILARHRGMGTNRVRRLVDQAVARVLHHVGDPAAPPLPVAETRPTACPDHPCDDYSMPGPPVR